MSPKRLVFPTLITEQGAVVVVQIDARAAAVGRIIVDQVARWSTRDGRAIGRRGGLSRGSGGGRNRRWQTLNVKPPLDRVVAALAGAARLDGPVIPRAARKCLSGCAQLSAFSALNNRAARRADAYDKAI